MVSYDVPDWSQLQPKISQAFTQDLLFQQEGAWAGANCRASTGSTPKFMFPSSKLTVCYWSHGLFSWWFTELWYELDDLPTSQNCYRWTLKAGPVVLEYVFLHGTPWSRLSQKRQDLDYETHWKRMETLTVWRENAHFQKPLSNGTPVPKLLKHIWLMIHRSHGMLASTDASDLSDRTQNACSGTFSQAQGLPIRLLRADTT